jgi:hypothetical protein
VILAFSFGHLVPSLHVQGNNTIYSIERHAMLATRRRAHCSSFPMVR